MKALLLLLTLPLFASAEEVLFRDPFAGQLADGWRVLRPAPEAMKVEDGVLRIRIEPGNMWGGANDARNVLVRQLPEVGEKGLRLGVTVENRPTAQFEQVDLVWYYNDSNMVKIGLELVDGQLSLVMGREEKDKTRTLALIAITDSKLDLRLTVRGKEITGEFRASGAPEWRLAAKGELPDVSMSHHASLQCYQGPDNAEHWARITDFYVRRP